MTIILIKVNDEVVGAIQSISVVNEAPTPDNANPKLEISRLRFNREKIKELFSNGSFLVKSQKIPIQIIVEEDKKEIMKIHNAWFTFIGHTYITDEWVIAEDIHLDAEYVSAEFNADI